MVDRRDPSSEAWHLVGSDDSARRVRAMLEESIAVKQRIIETDVNTIVRMAQVIEGVLRGGHKIYLCGNGGSAADAQHLAAELLVRLRPHVNRDPLPALALATDISSLTACSNDYAFDAYYERMVRALGRPGDVLIGITTSGSSANIVRALRAAREQQMVTLGLLGGTGGQALSECDMALIVPSTTTARIQEAHITVGHVVLELVEDLLLGGGQPR